MNAKLPIPECSRKVVTDGALEPVAFFRLATRPSTHSYPCPPDLCRWGNIAADRRDGAGSPRIVKSFSKRPLRVNALLPG